MTNELKNVPELRFSDFSEEWEDNLVGNLFEFKNGLNKGKEHFGYGLPIVNFKDVFHNRGIKGEYLNGKVNVSEKELQNYSVRKGDVFFTRTSEIIEEIGYPAVMMDEIPKAVFSGFVLRARPKKNIKLVDDKFKRYVFFTYSFRKEMITKSSITTRALTSGTAINKMKVVYPTSIEEQNKIGDFFSKLDQQIELEEQKLEKLEEQKKGYMQKLFSQELRFKDEKGNEYPEWEEKKLGDMLERGNKDKVNEIGKYRRLTISLHGKGLYEVKQERKTKDTRPFYQRFEGELIIGKQNFFNGSIAIVTSEFNGFICSNAIMSYKISNHMNRKYLLEYLLQNDFLRKNEYLADGTGQKELSEKKFEELEIKLPNSINEQQKIGVFLERLDNLIEKQSNKLELLKKRKQGFLQKMFV